MLKGAGINFKKLQCKTDKEVELSKGCGRHLHSDSLFHNSTFFQNYLSHLLHMIHATPFSDSFTRKWFIAHVSIELLLDRLAVKHMPQLATQFYKDLNSLEDETLLNFIHTNGAIQTESYINRFKHFREVQYIWYYTDTKQLIYSLNRIRNRVGLPEFEKNDELLFIDLIIEWENTYFANQSHVFKELKSVF